MYRKRNRAQMTVEDFVPPFGGKLDAENRWVKMAQIVPWDMVEDIYASSFKGDGRLDG
ncbi:MAG: IS5/IS1182 family transposase, partial [Oscillospiraceae bacterium]|nr:IS5/IS1182 family transposase [Oscillospiraceae bacterium]